MSCEVGAFFLATFVLIGLCAREQHRFEREIDRLRERIAVMEGDDEPLAVPRFLR